MSVERMGLAFLLMVFIVTQALCSKGTEARHTDHSHHYGRLRHHDVGSYYESDQHHTLPLLTPEAQNNTEFTAQLGGTARLTCFTDLLGDEMVSWMRRGDDEILTAGQQIFSSQDRYSVEHVRHQKTWQLSIRTVVRSDAGHYECQVATHPPVSLFFTLRVVEARAVIQGPNDQQELVRVGDHSSSGGSTSSGGLSKGVLHVNTGVQLHLKCTVEDATEPPLYIFWYHNDTMVNFGNHLPHLKVVKHRYSSSLHIPSVSWDNAGTYRCDPHLARPANLTLHVIAGETPAAIQRSTDSSAAAVDSPLTAGATTTLHHVTLFCTGLMLYLWTSSS